MAAVEPPVGLRAALDIALALPMCSSPEPGHRDLGASMLSVVLGRMDGAGPDDAGASPYARNLVATLWATARTLTAEREAAALRLEDVRASNQRARESLDALAGVGSLGLGGWAARLGAVVAGFGFPQLAKELMDHEREAAFVVRESVSVVQEVEIWVVQLMHEPVFEVLLAVSIAGSVVAVALTDAYLKRHRRDRLDELAAEYEAAAAVARDEELSRHGETLRAFMRSVARLLERYYPGWVTEELFAATGRKVTAEEVASGAADEVLDAVVAQHLDPDVCLCRI